jgi:hypothetical protein
MSSASLDLCRELYKLSGWLGSANVEVGIYNPGDEYDWWYDKYANPIAPRYDLGYLFRKFQEHKLDTVVRWVNGRPVDKIDLAIKEWHGKYIAGWLHLPFGEYFIADSPEDAACKMAIELFKRGILTKESKMSMYDTKIFRYNKRLFAGHSPGDKLLLAEKEAARDGYEPLADVKNSVGKVIDPAMITEYLKLVNRYPDEIVILGFKRTKEAT